MYSVSNTNLSIPALGRPFCLGMLYDCRNDQLIQGVSLWDTSTLEEKTVLRLTNTDSRIIASDSLEDKASALDINANLKLSFLGGLFHVSGSGKYLHNEKTSSKQERVTLQYKCSIRSEAMTMEQLGKGKVQHQDVFDNGIATHVVTGVEYGAQAFFIFERECSSFSLDKQSSGELQGMLKLIKEIPIDGKGQMDISENEKKYVENFTCTFIGDFQLQENPCTFEDAVRVYKNLPKLLGEEGQKAVPVKVTLYPLALLDNKASKFVRDINANLTSETEKVFENLHELTIRCNDLNHSSVAEKINIIQKEIRHFKSMIIIYKLEFQRQLAVLLPSIKGGGAEESQLADLLKKKEASPFSYLNLHTWLQDKEKLIKILNEYINMLSEIMFASEPGDLEVMMMKADINYIFCLQILIPQNNFQLLKMEMYNENKYDHESDNESTEGNFEDTLKRNYRDGEMSILKKVSQFRDFFLSNKESKGTSFAVTVNYSDTLDYQAHIQCFKQGGIINKNYEIPSEPIMPEADSTESTHNSFTIVWIPPQYGASSVQNYEILYQQVSTDNPPVSSRVKTDSHTLSYTVPNLEANCAYQVSVRSLCEAGVGPTSKTITVYTRPSCPPGKPQVWQTSLTSIEIQWSKPPYISPHCSIQKYKVKQQQKGTNLWVTKGFTKADELTYETKVIQDTTLRFALAADCGVALCSEDSDPSDYIYVKADDKAIKDSKSIKWKQELCRASNLVDKGPPSIYMLKTELVFSKDHDLIRKYELTTLKQKIGSEEKVILLVGATGSGKTTLINGIINYIFGVNWKDDFRFKLIAEDSSHDQAKSQTKHITSYTIHQVSSDYPYTLTIIDTPGFGDTSGVKRDQEITSQIHKFFTTQGPGGIDHIDAVGFVIQSSMPRLTPTQTYIFDQILSLFGKDIKDNIFLLLTFADGQVPQVLSGITAAGMPYRKYFKFNNSALFAKRTKDARNTAAKDESEEDEANVNFDEMFWKMGANSFKVFLKKLNEVDSRSLCLTQDVLSERGKLQNYIREIQIQIQAGLSALETLKTEAEIVKSHQADIDKNKNFTYKVNEEIYKQVEIPPGQYITNCQKCNRTCHELCKIADDNEKHRCWAITDGKCRICPGKCDWLVHKNFPYRYVLEVVERIKTADELRARYEEATQKKLTAEKLISKIKDEFILLQKKVLKMTVSVKTSLERLQEIALKPNPLSTVDYIDIMIENEKSQAQKGWMERIEQLRELRKDAEFIQKIADDDFHPFWDDTQNPNPEKGIVPKSRLDTVLEYFYKKK
ncbi:hypothetical protein OTU49_005472 [Cherax quadricarinatus]|uniref:Fibronectin type-III domain-containing protein n=1 Tax=Cherax quadricarinatus TaxID=27406 RepID=A0AAW0X8P7_CHEQU